ncbi:hypothetical protein FC15_GL000141 [Lapidilactobacillus concavus DSM 17758]|uniref:Phage shock protein PspC N-terminal domain-containing protein n=1 Tax=Lapidilactobacillus concavus DSM 17758 TaxID=1423735 RepID=A0A0R1WG54_9LACO|nr:PspC domain-containing protein [Lapidilactobacillus concavus]KRM12940.1 hypothetical protein FC15_GL000141 [Lapidilactobacillus concavus DSM 17758]GEL13794.1 hypothetical protein LCO01nite_13430 [Lapidilactobacillus concavus]
MEKRLYRSRTDRKIAGVAGGLAEYFGIDATLVRIAFALLILLASTGFWAYVILWIVMPERPASDHQRQDVTGDSSSHHDDNWSNF